MIAVADYSKGVEGYTYNYYVSLILQLFDASMLLLLLWSSCSTGHQFLACCPGSL